MPLEAPNLDTRTFDQLKSEALARIVRYLPEWTDFNESDPGMTLVELFAWLTETMLYEMNRVPNMTYIKFLQFLGLELEAPEPAVGYLTFNADPSAIPPPGSESITVPSGTRVAAQPAGGGAQVVFETVNALDLVRVPLTDVQVYDGATFTVLTSANNKDGVTYRPFGWSPQPGSALYLGFTPPPPPASPPPGTTEGPQVRLFPRQISFRVTLDAVAQAGKPLICRDAVSAPAPVKLVWEYRPDVNAAYWRKLETDGDDSNAFTREGVITVLGPSDIMQTVEGRVADDRYWLRVRLDSGAYPTGREPVIERISVNGVKAENLSTVRDEILGISNGLPNQRFTFDFRPVRADSVKLVVRDQDCEESWERRDDFFASGQDDADYVLRATAGEVIFGDDIQGRIPKAGAEIIARCYRYGGGVVGNVAARQVNSLQNSVQGVTEVFNERPAVGGRDEQTDDDFLRCAPQQLLHHNRAVSADDYAALAQEVGGIKKAIALPLYHPAYPGVQVPGAVTVLVIPDSNDDAPRPSQDQLDAVCSYLATRRTVGTELHIAGPEYKAIQVSAKVSADPYTAFDEVARQVRVALNNFLDPLGRSHEPPATAPAAGCPGGQTTAPQLKGGSDFGKDLYPLHLYAVIQSVPAVHEVLGLGVSVNGQVLNSDQLGKAIVIKPNEIVYGAAAHDIQVEPYKDLGGQA